MHEVSAAHGCARGRAGADPGRVRRPPRRARRLARAGGAGARVAAPAARRARAHAARTRGAGRAGGCGALGCRVRRDHQRVGPASPPRPLRIAGRARPRGRAGCRGRGARARDGDRGDSLLSVAAVIPGKGHDVLLDALATLNGRRWQCLCVGTLERDPAYRRERCGAAPSTAGWTAACASRGRCPKRISPAATPRPICWCFPRARRRTGWSSPRRSPAGCRSSPPTSAACRRRWDTAQTERGRECWFPPTTRLRSATRCVPGSRIAGLRRRLRRAARERRESLPDWSATTSALADVLASAA